MNKKDNTNLSYIWFRKKNIFREIYFFTFAALIFTMIKSKVPNIKTSIFAVMTSMAKEYDAVNLSQGFPDFQVSNELISLVNKYMSEGFNQYAPMPGIPELRNHLSKKTFKN